MYDASLTRSTAPFNAHDFDDDRVDSGQHNRHASFDALISNAHEASTCPANLRLRGHSPTRRKREEKVSIRRGVV